MKLKIYLLISIAFFVFHELKSQCQNQFNYTYTITGNYTSAINSQTTNNYYIAPNATVTGNIDLNHGQIMNCGRIINQKIKIKNVTNNNQGSIENQGIIITDTLLVDTLGDLHNRGSFTSKCIYTRFQANISNVTTINTNTLIVDDNSFLDNFGSSSKVLTKTTKFNNSWCNNEGLIYAEDFFHNSSGSLIYNLCTIQVDSLFRNSGGFNGTNQGGGTIFSSILIENKSENYGQISNNEFCDHTSINGGGLDINTGSTTGVTYCEKDPNCITLNWVGIREDNLNLKSVSAYPNPFSDKLSINLPADFNFANSSISVFDNLGREVFEEKNIDRKKEIDLSFLNTGVYHLKLKSDNSLRAFKILKQ